MSSVRVENATKDYQLGRTTVPALRGVSLAVERGEFITVAGPSGSGKSTLLNLIGCLDHPTSGRVLIGDEDVATLGDDALSDLRAEKIGFIFQTFNLIPVLSALENVEFPLLVRQSVGKGARTSARERATQAYERIVEFEPDPQAAEALEGLYGEAGRWEDLIELYQRQLEVRDKGPGFDSPSAGIEPLMGEGGR